MPMRTATTEKASRFRPAGRVGTRLSAFLGPLVLVGMVVAASLLSPYFLRLSNISNVLRQVAENGIIAVGMTLVILTGGIDLSVGSVLALTNCLAAGLLVHSGQPLWVVVPLVLAAGVAMGVANGGTIARARIEPFVVTLAMMSVARGLAYIYSGGRPIVIPEEPATAGFLRLGQDIPVSPEWGIPVPALFFLAAAALGALLLRHTAVGRRIFAIGGNREAARLSGIPVGLTLVTVYGICGLLSALAGLLHASMLNCGHPNEGVGLELNAIAATVIGGTSLAGGAGSVGGTVIGAMIIGILNNVLQLRDVNPYVQMLLKGLVIVLAVMAQRARKR